MPIYEYYCAKCERITDRMRLMSARRQSAACDGCGGPAEFVCSAPSLGIWKADRPFLNAVKSGDGKFPTKAAYEAHLKANDMAESSTDGKIERPHGNRVVGTWR